MGVKLNPFTGKLDLVSKEADNFSIVTIDTGETKTIPSKEQMIVYNLLENDGELVIDGHLVLEDFAPLTRLVNTGATETLNIEGLEVIRQTSSGITTSLSGAVAGSRVTITNRSGGDNTLNITIQGVASPTIKDLESFSLVYNGTDYDFT